MNGELSKQDCIDFQSHLPELVGAGAKLSNHPHIMSCILCRALLADLETIAEAARQLFPAAEPPDEVWELIEYAIKKENGPELSMMAAGGLPKN